MLPPFIYLDIRIHVISQRPSLYPTIHSSDQFSAVRLIQLAPLVEVLYHPHRERCIQVSVQNMKMFVGQKFLQMKCILAFYSIDFYNKQQ